VVEGGTATQKDEAEVAMEVAAMAAVMEDEEAVADVADKDTDSPKSDSVSPNDHAAQSLTNMTASPTRTYY
jgi:hypothetical protein